MKNFIVTAFFCLVSLAGNAQYLTGCAARYSDSFVEWYFYTEVEDEEGELKIRWLQQNDWSEWDYRLNDLFGSIKLKWRDNPNEWELRGNNRIVTAKTIWNDDLREWRITDNTVTLTLKTRWGNQLDEWELRDKNHGAFRIYTTWERDPRDWTIVDELGEKVSFEMKMMMLFIAVYHSSPKQ
jgi:hypothetical protein